MRILHIASISKRKDSGVSVAVPRYFVKQKAINPNTYLINVSKDEIINDNNFFCKNNISDIKKTINNTKPDIVVFHEIYRPIFIKIYKELVKQKIPYIIIPHGSLTKYAQRQKLVKKTIANIIFFNKFIKKASRVQFLSQKEKNDSIHNNKSVVLGGGIEVPKENQYLLHHANKKNITQIVYVGRYDEKIKGIDALLAAAKHIDKKIIKISLFGTTNNEKQIKKYRSISCESVKINGPIYGDKKIAELLRNDVYIQVSRTEAQPLGVMEALSLGMPCILSYGTGLDKEVINKVGVPVNTDEKEIANAIIYMHNNRNKLESFSKNAHEYAKKQYDWPRVIENTLRTYDAIIKEGANVS